MPIDALLADVLDAHGGLRGWWETVSITARLRIGGPFWVGRGWAGEVPLVATLDSRRQHVELTYGDLRATFDVGPERLALRTAAGRLVDSRVEPRTSFPCSGPHAQRWDAVQIAYVLSTSIWNALTAPFSFTALGVGVHEIEPCEEDGEEWRRLAVMFPPSNANHNADQVFCYDADFMLRRWDYAPEVAGGLPIAHYAERPERFGGFMFPTRRRAYARGPDGVADRSHVLIAEAVDDLVVRRGRRAAGPSLQRAPRNRAPGLGLRAVP